MLAVDFAGAKGHVPHSDTFCRVSRAGAPDASWSVRIALDPKITRGARRNRQPKQTALGEIGNA